MRDVAEAAHVDDRVEVRGGERRLDVGDRHAEPRVRLLERVVEASPTRPRWPRRRRGRTRGTSTPRAAGRSRSRRRSARRGRRRPGALRRSTSGGPRSSGAARRRTPGRTRPPEPEASDQVVRADLERDERDVPAPQHRDRLVELRALGVRAARLGAVDRARPLAGTGELDQPQIRQARLFELEDLLRVAAVRVAVRLEARRERIAEREVRRPGAGAALDGAVEMDPNTIVNVATMMVTLRSRMAVLPPSWEEGTSGRGCAGACVSPPRMDV